MVNLFRTVVRGKAGGGVRFPAGAKQAPADGKAKTVRRGAPYDCCNPSVGWALAHR